MTTKTIIEISNSSTINETSSRKLELREKIVKLQEAILDMPGAVRGDQPDCPVIHTFAPGLYKREIFNPADHLIVTKIHKMDHFYFLIQGSMSILTEQGKVFIKAPYHGITKAGTKRVIYTHEPCIFITVHSNPDDIRDMEVIENRLIAEDFDGALPDMELLRQIGGTK